MHVCLIKIGVLEYVEVNQSQGLNILPLNSIRFMYLGYYIYSDLNSQIVL